MYHHVTRDHRIALSALLRAGHSMADAARNLGVHRSTITREIRRNARIDGYHAGHANRLGIKRRRFAKLNARKIENDSALQAMIIELLHPLCSPETVAHEVGIAHASIYAWIERSRPDMRILLPYRGKKRRRYGAKRQKKQGWTRHVRSIHDRPAEADDRSQPSHFEGDTIRGIHGGLLTHTDRASRYECAHLIRRELADTVHGIVADDPHLSRARSITYDRGSCFALWRQIERDTGVDIYFADPRSPWQRGTNENANGRLRRVFPKQFDFATITQEDVDATVWKMNHTRRKCLAWRTPCEVYGRCCTSG